MATCMAVAGVGDNDSGKKSAGSSALHSVKVLGEAHKAHEGCMTTGCDLLRDTLPLGDNYTLTWYSTT